MILRVLAENGASVVDQVIGFMHHLSSMPQDSIHVERLEDDIADAQECSSYGNWAGSIVKKYNLLGMALPWSGITGPNFHGFTANTVDQLWKLWDGLHVRQRSAPSEEAKLCTYLTWFLRSGQLRALPGLEIPTPISKLQLLMQLPMGSCLSVKQGRLALPAIFWHLRRCTLCDTQALGDERRFGFDCHHHDVAHIRDQSQSGAW